MSALQNRYVIVMACAIGLGLSFAPLFFYTIPVLMKPMAAANGWTRTEVSTGISMATLCLAIGSPLVGLLVDRLGVRRVVIVSALALAGALYLFSWVSTSLIVFYLLAALVGFSSVGVSPLSYTVLLGKWFDARLGTAIGFSMVGMGLGYALAPVVAAQLLQNFGWRSAYVVLACIGLLPVLNALIFIREPAVGEPTELTHRGSRAKGEGMTLREAFRSTTFWLFVGSAFLVSMAINGTAVHLVSLISDRGYGLSDAAAAGAVLGVTITIARLGTGILLDRLPMPAIAAVAFVGGAAGMALLWSGQGGAVPFIAAACMGLAAGAEVDVLAFGTRRFFGTRAFGQISGVVTSVFTLGAVVGPMLHGVGYDRFGSYDQMLLIFAGMCLVAAIAALCLGTPRYLPQRDAASTGVIEAKALVNKTTSRA